MVCTAMNWGTYDIPMDVLEGESEVVEGIEPILQEADDGLGVAGFHPGDGVGDR